MEMKRRSTRQFWLALAIGFCVAPLVGAGCNEDASDDDADGSAGAGGGASDGSGGDGSGGDGSGGDGDAGSGSGGRDVGAGSGGRLGDGGAPAIPNCLDELIDETCSVATRTAVDGWNCILRFPRDSLTAEEGASARVFVDCDEAGLGGAAGAGSSAFWTFDHRSDTLTLGRDICEGLEEGDVVTAIAGCH
jgi:hypothetical protein